MKIPDHVETEHFEAILIENLRRNAEPRPSFLTPAEQEFARSWLPRRIHPAMLFPVASLPQGATVRYWQTSAVGESLEKNLAE